MTQTTSSSSSSKSRDEISKNKVHLVPKSWMNELESYLQTKLPSKKPSRIENATLLQFYDGKVKKVLVASSTPGSSSSAGNSSAPPPTNNLPTAVPKKLSYRAAVVSDTATSTTTTSSESGGSDSSSMGIIVGRTSTPTSPTSSDATNNSFVVVQSDAHSFVREETTTQTTSATTNNGSTASSISFLEEEKIDEDAENEEMDDRTKRRLKWAKIRDQEQSTDTNNSTTSKSTFKDKVGNVPQTSSTKCTLKDDLKHDTDYCILGNTVWVLLSQKFGFDVDIESTLYFNDKVGNSHFGGWGRLSITGLKVKRSDCSNNFSQNQNEDLMIPENGVFDYLEKIVSEKNVENCSNDYVGDLEDEDLVSHPTCVVALFFDHPRKLQDNH